ncbi:Ig-like domain-containing protein [Candidatus Margulisiibacteriota bacterium]
MIKKRFFILLMLFVLTGAFGAFAVDNVGDFTAVSAGQTRINLSWTPVDCQGVIIKASKTHYPANPTSDGQLVGILGGTATETTFYTVSTNTTFYFTAFCMKGFEYSTGVTASATTDPNNPPTVPTANYPADGMRGIVEQPVTFNVSFSTTDNIDHDPIQVDIYFGREGEPLEMVTRNLWTWGGTTGDYTQYNVGEIESATTYNWKVIAKNIDVQVSGPTWSFTTRYAGVVDYFEDGNLSTDPEWWTDGVTVNTVDSTAEGSYGMQVSGTANAWYIGGAGTTYTQDVSDFNYISLFVKNDTEWASRMVIGLKETDGDEWAYTTDVNRSDWTEINIPVSAFTYNGGDGDRVYAVTNNIEQFTLNLNATTVNNEIIGYSVDKVRFMQSASLINSPPQIIARSPSGNSYYAPLMTSIKAVFSEAMNKASVESAFSITPARSGTLTWAGNTLIFSPASSLNSNTTYNISFAGAKDLNGDLLAGNTGWSFNTGGGLDDGYEPQVLACAPAGTDNPLKPTILITFSDAMDKNSVENGVIINDGINESYASTMGTFHWLGNSVAIVPDDPLDPNTVYTVTVNAAVTDADNDSLIDDFSFSFKTGNGFGESIPYVQAHGPVGIGVELSPTISILFSEAMKQYPDIGNVSDNFQFSGGNNGTISQEGSLFNFKPAIDLNNDTRYTVTVTTGVLDSEGDSLADDKVWSFQAGVSDVNPPEKVTGLSITSNGSVYLSWTAATDNISIPSAIKYEIIYSRQPTFGSVTTIETSPGVPSVTLPGLGSETYYFIVKAIDEAGNRGVSSNVAVNFVSWLIPSPNSDLQYWFSIPSRWPYLDAAALSLVLPTENFKEIGYLKYSNQKIRTYAYIEGFGWGGHNFSFDQGKGYFVTLKAGSGSVTWNICGVEESITLNIAQNSAKSKKYWFSLPYNAVYKNASDIALEIDSSQITIIGMYDYRLAVTREYIFNGSVWSGEDFIINTGDAYFFRIEPGTETIMWKPSVY